eukprot:361635_1
MSGSIALLFFILINTVILDVHGVDLDRYDSTSVHTDLNVGDMVLIKFYQGGYLKIDGDGTLSTNPKYNSDLSVWEIRQDYGGGGNIYNFKNLANGNYLKSDGSTCYDEAVSNGGSWAMWDLSYRAYIGQSYRRAYVKLKSPTFDACCASSEPTDTTI